MGTLSDLYEVLRKSRISIASLLLVAGIFIWLPQAQDIIRTLAQPGIYVKQLVIFEILLFLWALTVWFGARSLLDQDFAAMRAKKKSGIHARSLWGEKYFPRFLGAASISSVGFAMIKTTWPLHDHQGMQYSLVKVVGGINIALGIALFFLLKYRRKIFSITGTEYKVASFNDYPFWLRAFIYAALIIPASLWLSIIIWGVQNAPSVGSLSVVMLSVFFLTIFGTALAWFSERWNFPLIFVIVLLSVLGGYLFDVHEIRDNGKPVEPAKGISARALFKGWLDGMNRKYGEKTRHPMFIVAASGGGIKAAYWTASVLSNLQNGSSSFAEHTIVISSISGGTLGSVIFAKMASNPDIPAGDYLKASQSALSRDFISPVLAALLFKDIFPFPHKDRAEALETAWERAFDPELNTSLPPSLKGRKLLNESFGTIEESERSHVIPTLIINGTVVETGERILTTHMNLNCREFDCYSTEKREAMNFSDCVNTFSLRNKDVNLSTAALLSSRFTYVSPAGTLKLDDKHKGKVDKVHVVDGGSFENSGATTAMQFYDCIKELIDDAGNVDVYFIQIDNDYVNIYNRHDFSGDNSAYILPDAGAPVRALLNTRNAHAVSAVISARRMLKNEIILYNFSSIPNDVKAPLGWYLSNESSEKLKEQMKIASNKANNEKIKNLLKNFSSAKVARKKSSR